MRWLRSSSKPKWLLLGEDVTRTFYVTAPYHAPLACAADFVALQQELVRSSTPLTLCVLFPGATQDVYVDTGELRPQAKFTPEALFIQQQPGSEIDFNDEAAICVTRPLVYLGTSAGSAGWVDVGGYAVIRGARSDTPPNFTAVIVEFDSNAP